MRHWLLVSMLLAAAVAACPASASAQGVKMRELSPAELAKVEAGEVILESQTYQDAQGRTRGRGLAIGFVKADKGRIMDTILGYEAYPQFMPRVKTTAVYGRTDTQVNVKFTIEVVMVKVSYHITHQVDRAAGTISWTLDKSRPNEIAATDGFWGLKPHKNGTLLYYTVAVDTGRSIPKAIEDYLTKKDLPNIVKSIKKRVGG
jgi:ribosome-associated toxin RatA of RatAB toxin-antitoxin module